MEKHSGLSISKGQNIRIGCFLTGSFVFAFLLFYAFPNVFRVWQYRIQDQLFQLRHEIKGNDEIYPYISHVDLNDLNIHNLTRFVWDRSLYAEIIDVLTEAYAEIIAFDIIFIEPSDREADRSLIASTQESGKVIYPVIMIPCDPDETRTPLRISSDVKKLLKKNLWYPEIIVKGKPSEACNAVPTFPGLSMAARGIGHITCYPDRDGVFRRYPLLLNTARVISQAWALN